MKRSHPRVLPDQRYGKRLKGGEIGIGLVRVQNVEKVSRRRGEPTD